MKRAMLKSMRRYGVFAAFRKMNKHKALIVTYHRFSRVEDGRSTSADALADQLAYLNAHYSVVPLSELAEYIVNARPLPPRAAAVTIDDGFRDAFEIAFPLLRDNRIPATLFVITDFVDGKIWLWTDKLRYLTSRAPAGSARIKFREYDTSFKLDGTFSRLAAADSVNSILKTLPDNDKDAAIEEIAANLNVSLPDLPTDEFGPISWDQAIEMDRAGIEVGSHTITHPILPNVSDDHLVRELNDSRIRLETVLSRKSTLFCYPNGSHDRRVRLAVAKAGYECAVTTELGLIDRLSDPLALRRIPAEMDLDHFAQSTSGFEQVKNRLIHHQ
jgi:peptidoglycan/xylan/chitin deacetylase (PgdA/CDA1 family)